MAEPSASLGQADGLSLSINTLPPSQPEDPAPRGGDTEPKMGVAWTSARGDPARDRGSPSAPGGWAGNTRDCPSRVRL